MKFLLIFLIVFLAFTFALNNLFWYYQMSTREQIQAIFETSQKYQNETTQAEKYFGRLYILKVFLHV
jgi:hypothetical protein